MGAGHGHSESPRHCAGLVKRPATTLKGSRSSQNAESTTLLRSSIFKQGRPDGLKRVVYCKEDVGNSGSATLNRSRKRVFGDSCLLLFVFFFVFDPTGMKGKMGSHLLFMNFN